ncbi:metalloregulator ArsR/SmtB family transcription factor [Deinococcus sp. YIM 134068]|uniref:ArsR/SmtB family transcription factor n=1 Tax=Deinococcus lichenicola TaxID=3118910 RepID=UPI002F93E7D5
MTTLAVPTVLDQIKALAHEIRYDLIRHLAHGERCVCDLEALLEFPQSKVSYHLGILKEADLVRAEQRGKNMYYTLRRDQLFHLGGGLLTEIFADVSPLTHQTESIC